MGQHPPAGLAVRPRPGLPAARGEYPGGAPAASQAQWAATGHSSQRGRGTQTSAPSSISASFQCAETPGSSGSSAVARPRSAAVTDDDDGAALPLRRARTRRTLVSSTAVRRVNANAATAAAV